MKKIISFILLLNILLFNTIPSLANIANSTAAVDTSNNSDKADLVNQKHPCYNQLYLNEDKYENFNRKVFNLNLKLNRIFVKKIHILWASIMPNFVIDSLNRAYSNIEYPKRLVSSLIQRDFDAVKNETKRFLINTTLGVAGMIDAANLIFKLEMYDEDMEQALAKCKCKCGKYLVLPFISSTTTRDLFGRLFDFALNPTTYIASPIAAAIKMGLLINRTAYIQPMIKMVESNFADPYDIARKFFGVEKYIKLSNYDRAKVLETFKDDYDEVDLVDSKKQENLDVKGKISGSENLILNDIDDELTADIILTNYNPQNPVLDSMRTALFDLADLNKSMWSEISIWNRSFNKKIKTASVSVVPNRPEYKFRYILQKDKTSPLAILFPSVGEGINNTHSTILAKLFYDEGYSVLIFGNHFQWEFLKSIEKGHKIGIIKDDVKYINLLVNNAIKYLSQKYDRVFIKRTAMGTSLGAYALLFLANEQYETGAKNIDKFIAVCPPYELMYAAEKIDKLIEAWKNYPNDLKQKVALTAAKVMRAYNEKNKYTKNLNNLPFSNYEAKLISAYIFHQKLSDLIYTTEVENNKNIDKKELYSAIYNTNLNDYLAKNFLVKYSLDELKNANSLNSISDYLINSDNYVIYHSLDDYLTDKKELKNLRKYCENKLVLFNNGAHLGFLYRDEFIDELKKQIKLNPLNTMTTAAAGTATPAQTTLPACSSGIKNAAKNAAKNITSSATQKEAQQTP